MCIKQYRFFSPKGSFLAASSIGRSSVSYCRLSEGFFCSNGPEREEKGEGRIGDTRNPQQARISGGGGLERVGQRGVPVTSSRCQFLGRGG